MAAALLAVGCGGSVGEPRVARQDGPVFDDFEDPSDRVREFMDTEDLMLSEGDYGSLAALMAPDTFWFGAGPDHVATGRPAVGAAMRELFGHPSGTGSRVVFRTPHEAIAVAPDRTAAWVVEEMPGTMSGPEGTREIPFRVSSYVVREQGRWLLAAQHWSVGADDGAAAVAAGPAPVPERVENGAGALEDALDAAIGDAGTLATFLARRSDVFGVGPAPGDSVQGIDAARALLEDRFAGAEFEIAGDVHAAIGPGGTTGYTAANVVVASGGGDRGVLRGLFVWLREGDDWRIVHFHLSAPLPD